jgi:hypothetical protein
MLWRILGKSTSRGQQADSPKSGWSNTTENTETTLKSNEIYTKTNNMSLKTYQWIKGERAGDVVKTDSETVEDGGMLFLVFTDGSRCNASLVGDYILEVENDNPENLFMINDIAPQALQRVEPVVKEVKQLDRVKPDKTASPLEALLLSSKKSEQKVGVTISINVPPFDLIKVLASSFDDGQEQVLRYLQDSITPEMVDGLKRQIALELTADIFDLPEAVEEILQPPYENLENYERV